MPKTSRGSVFTEHRVAAIPQSIVTFHQLTEMGQADRILPSPSKLMVRHDLVAQDRELWALLKDAEILWLIYEKGEDDGTKL